MVSLYKVPLHPNTLDSDPGALRERRYANYVLPPSRRRLARDRTAPLGLGISSADLDDKPPPSSDAVFESNTHARASVLLPRKPTLRSLLPSSSFRLHNLATAFFQPVQKLFGANHHFLRDAKIGEMDCLVYGYLALMLYPELPDAWLRETLRREEFRELRAWVDRVHDELELGVEEVLPWTVPPPTNTLTSALSTLVPHLPILGPLCVGPTIIISSRPAPSAWQQYRTPFPLLLLVASGTLGLGVYISFLHAGALFWPVQQQKGQGMHIFGRRRWEDYGELGAAIAGVWGSSSSSSSSSQQRRVREVGRGEGERLGKLEPVGLGVGVERE